MQLPGPGVWDPPRDHVTALAVLRRAVELGVTHIDTSDSYGPHVANDQPPGENAHGLLLGSASGVRTWMSPGISAKKAAFYMVFIRRTRALLSRSAQNRPPRRRIQATAAQG